MTDHIADKAVNTDSTTSGAGNGPETSGLSREDGGSLGIVRDLSLRELMAIIKRDNQRWWVQLDGHTPLDRNVGEVLALIHSEISEALEGHRKGLMDDHLPHRKMFTVELVDAIIRIIDAAAHWAEDLPEALMEKLEYNRHRADHRLESRKLANGKKY